jgi:phosphosulfolactate synthase (CoM biosynthesis protein A)
MVYTYKDISLTIVERLITIGGLHKIIFEAPNKKKVNLISKKSIRLDSIEKYIKDNYERIKFFIS